MNKLSRLQYSALFLAVSSALVLVATVSNPYALPNIYSDLFFEPLQGWSELLAVIVAPVAALTVAAVVLVGRPALAQRLRALMTLGAASFSVVSWLVSDVVWSLYIGEPILNTVFYSLSGNSLSDWGRLTLLASVVIAALAMARGDDTGSKLKVKSDFVGVEKSNAFLRNLFDPSLEKFISRHVAGALYTVICLLYTSDAADE
jgi:hypothetical protein